ncbi:MAG: LptF/LptG family permease [Bacteroidales bacterium]|nr:LptF/LptG family permease [Bacteroidales bacterium]MDD4384281.1 LptF/LptG family permease [Bacteroidales bacterium]
MKRLHWFVLKSYLGPLIMTFFIVMFILLMQFLWKYIDDLVGKGLELDVIIELLVYASAGLVPMALPLSTLLASLMTLGNLGENNELLAMKSAGISLPRIMLPLIVVTILISAGGFFFSNNVLPYTNLKMSTLLWDVKQQRPDLSIKVGVFNNDIEGYSIKISNRDPQTNLMENVIIYDHRSKEGNLVVTVADSGYMHLTKDEKFMVVTLYTGYSYEEMLENRTDRRAGSRKFPSRRNKFDEQVILIELEGFGLERSNEDLFKSSFHALNLQQLGRTQDSLANEIDNRLKVAKDALVKHTIFQNPFSLTRDSAALVTYRLNADSILTSLPEKQQHGIVERALSSARAAKNSVSSTAMELDSRSKHMVRHTIEWHRKFALPFACFVFFFIGAPLGAIIRKGGLGMPVVVSVLFFVVYYVISLTGEKFARELLWDPNVGMWLSSFILLPLGAFLSYKATADSVIMNSDFYIQAFKKLSAFYGKVKSSLKRK